MKGKKICPLITIASATTALPSNIDLIKTQCYEGECAWWNNVEEKCSVSLMGAESGLRLRKHDEGREWR